MFLHQTIFYIERNKILCMLIATPLVHAGNVIFKQELIWIKFFDTNKILRLGILCPKSRVHTHEQKLTGDLINLHAVHIKINTPEKQTKKI
jgi:hypothetical protein